MASRLISAGLALGIAIAGPAGAIDLPDIPHEFYRLDNGLEVILHEDHSTPIVGVNIWYHVGSKNERPGRSGFAHLFEHMMFQGSEHHDSEFFEPLQSVGGRLNGSTSEDRTNYWEIVPANHLERALMLEADRMGWLLPAMTQEKLDNQRDVVRNERRQSEGWPYSVFWLNFNENFYPEGHPYDHSVIGSHEDLEKASLDDVKEFFRTYYAPNNATLSIAGDFDPDQVKSWVEKYFAEIPPGEPIEEVDVWIPELNHEKRIRSEDDVQLTRLYYCWHSPPYYHEGDADLDLAAKIFGQGRTSRLYRRLVHEEKLAQEVSASQESQQISSVWRVTITLRPDATVEAVERILDEELARFAEDGPTREELERAQSVVEASFLKGIQRVGSWGGKNDRLNRYNHYVGTPDYFRQDYERFRSRTVGTVRETFTRWIGPGRMVVEVTPFDELEAREVAGVDRTEFPEAGGEPPLAIPRIHRRKLDNGLELAVLEQRELPLVRLDFVFHSGTGADPTALGGLTDLSAAMLLEGTKRMDKFEFESEMERLGTDFGVVTGDDYTTFHLLCLRKNLDASLKLFAQALLQPAFPEHEFADQKERRIVDIRREKDSPYRTSSKVTRRILFGESHPYGRIGTGTEESMEAISLEDVREHARTHFTPGNATLVAIGDIRLQDLAKHVSRWLGKWEGSRPPGADIPEPSPLHGRIVYLVDRPGDTQSTISIAHLGIPRNHPDWEKVFVANRVLGGFFSSRLNLNLREDKGYSYGVRSSTRELVGTSFFTMSGRVQTEVTAPALVEFLKELEGVAGSNPIGPQELAFAKNSILKGYPLRFETLSQLADAVTDQIIYGLPDDDFALFPRKIEAVDVATVNETAAAYFHPHDLAIIVVGDREKIEDSIRELDLGPIRYADPDGALRERERGFSSQ